MYNRDYRIVKTLQWPNSSAHCKKPEGLYCQALDNDRVAVIFQFKKLDENSKETRCLARDIYLHSELKQQMVCLHNDFADKLYPFWFSPPLHRGVFSDNFFFCQHYVTKLNIPNSHTLGLSVQSQTVLREKPLEFAFITQEDKSVWTLQRELLTAPSLPCEATLITKKENLRSLSLFGNYLAIVTSDHVELWDAKHDEWRCHHPEAFKSATHSLRYAVTLSKDVAVMIETDAVTAIDIDTLIPISERKPHGFQLNPYYPPMVLPDNRTLVNFTPNALQFYNLITARSEQKMFDYPIAHVTQQPNGNFVILSKTAQLQEMSFECTFLEEPIDNLTRLPHALCRVISQYLNMDVYNHTFFGLKKPVGENGLNKRKNPAHENRIVKQK